MGRYDEWIEELVGRLILEEPEGNLFSRVLGYDGLYLRELKAGLAD
jgi:hypothetical protein